MHNVDEKGLNSAVASCPPPNRSVVHPIFEAEERLSVRFLRRLIAVDPIERSSHQFVMVALPGIGCGKQLPGESGRLFRPARHRPITFMA